MLLELWAKCDGGAWRAAHLVRCFNYPTPVGTAMMVPGSESGYKNYDNDYCAINHVDDVCHQYDISTMTAN